jgi:nucleoside permease NupC
MTFILAILFIMFVLGPIARAIAVSIEKSGEKRALEAQTGASEQLVALSEQMHLLAERVDRLSEEQSFLLSVMEEEPRLLEEPGVATPSAGEDTRT